MQHQDLKAPNKQLAELMKNPATANVSEVINLLKQQQAQQSVSYFSKPVLKQLPPSTGSIPAKKKDMFSLMDNLFSQTAPTVQVPENKYNLFA